MLPTLRHVLAPRWNPLQLGADLLAWWSADRNDSILRTGGTPIVSWVDVKNGYVATQGTSGSRPAYSPTGLRTNMVDASGSTAYRYDGRNRLVEKVKTWAAVGCR